MHDGLVFWSGEAAELSRWTTAAADGSSMAASVEGSALRLDFDLAGPTSWVIARRECHVELPAHYVVVMRLRGEAPANQLQFKLVDPSGQNVWWWRRTDFTPQPETETVTLRRAALEFAWGPASGGDPREVRAVELALAAGEGGAGTIWIEDLRIEARDPAGAFPLVHAVSASSAAPGHAAECSLTGDPAGDWRPAKDDARPWLQLDLARSCEWGGVVLDFEGEPPRGECRLLASDDGESWRPVLTAGTGGASRCWLRTSDAEGRYARIEFDEAPAVARAGILPLAQAVSPARYMASVARGCRRGLFPRHLLDEQAYWAVVGADGDERKGLLSEDGALETGAESFSIEPFVWADGRLATWADATTRVELAHGHLPIPSVEWQLEGLKLRITAFASGEAGASTLVGRYEIENTSDAPRPLRLFLAIRPFQVNPAWQSLNLVGGVAPITRLARSGSTVKVGLHEVRAVSGFDAFGVFASEEGLTSLEQGTLPARDSINDPLGFAHGVLAWDLELAARAVTAAVIAVPLHDASPSTPEGLELDAAAAWASQRLSETAAHWRSRLSVVPIELPAAAAAFADTLKASIAWILVNREGPRIQPGPRCYRRSWIRDGTLTGTALAEMGFVAEAREFLRWYAPYQHEDGRIPCAVDRHGVDPVAEHDSHGQFIWGIVEVSRLAGDRDFLVEMWPRIRRAADAIVALRAQRTTEHFRGRACFGLMPESISHEGYSSQPVHAFWDDFFAVRGLADAAQAASVAGDEPLVRYYTAQRDAMRRDLHAAIVRTIADHGIDFIPGAVELGDFDPTSTAIALDPGGEGAALPAAALARTFERYWHEFEQRRSGERVAEAYTAYEVRNAPALVLLGEKQKAVELLAWLIDDQRPAAWRQWPEVTTRDPRTPRFLGDLPHGWIASSFVRSVRRMLAYERAEDDALVLAAGVPAAWVEESPGIAVRGLAIHSGTLDYSMCCDGRDAVRVTIGGGFRWPDAGVVVESPLARPIRRVVVDGRAEDASDPRRVLLRLPAAGLVLQHEPG